MFNYDFKCKRCSSCCRIFLEHQDEFLDHPYCGKLEPILSAAYIYETNIKYGD
jgi:hypothetical protein